MPEEELQAKDMQETAKRIAQSRERGASNDELASFLTSLGDLHIRVGALENRTTMLNDSIEKSNELHQAHREALDNMTSLLAEVRDMLSIYNNAKSTIKVIGWFTSSVRRSATFICAAAVIYIFWRSGWSLSTVAKVTKGE